MIALQCHLLDSSKQSLCCSKPTGATLTPLKLSRTFHLVALFHTAETLVYNTHLPSFLWYSHFPTFQAAMKCRLCWVNRVIQESSSFILFLMWCIMGLLLKAEWLNCTNEIHWNYDKTTQFSYQTFKATLSRTLSLHTILCDEWFGWALFIVTLIHKILYISAVGNLSVF